MPAPHNPNQNHLLAALPTAEFERLAPHLELSRLSLGEVVYESGRPACDTSISHYFHPVHTLRHGGWSSAEIAGVGNEGVLGISIFMEAIPRPAGPSCRPRATVTG